MRAKGHLAGGYLVSQAIVAAMPVTGIEALQLLAVGAAAGVAPDLDTYYYMASRRTTRKGSDFRHHTWFTHTFPFYLAIAGLTWLLGSAIDNVTVQRAALLFAAATSMHLFQDSIGSGDGIMPFWPFSRRMVGLWLMYAHGDEWTAKYSRHRVRFIELGYVVLGLVVLPLSVVVAMSG